MAKKISLKKLELGESIKAMIINQGLAIEDILTVDVNDIYNMEGDSAGINTQGGWLGELILFF